MNWSQELTYLSNNTSNFLLKKKEKNVLIRPNHTITKYSNIKFKGTHTT